MFHSSEPQYRRLRRLNGRREAVARQEIGDDVRGYEQNVPASKPILAGGGVRFGGVVGWCRWG